MLFVIILVDLTLARVNLDIQEMAKIALVSYICLTSTRGIEWSLQAFASMRAVRLFLRARAVISFVMRAASTLKITKDEQQALRKFSTSWNLSLLKHCFASRNMVDTFKTGQQAQTPR